MAWSYLSQFDGRPLLRQAVRPTLTFVVVATLGILGYMVLGDIGFIEAAFWLLDPTSIHLHFQEHSGPETLTKLYAITVTVGLILVGIWAGETVLSVAFGDQIRTELAHARIRRRIMNLDEHVIICGYGMFGRTIAQRLTAAGVDLVVIEIDEAMAEMAREDGHLVVEGDARQEATLEASNLERARSLVTAVDDSNVNVQVAITASGLAPELSITVRIGDDMYESLARRAGADKVVIPEVLSGEDVASVL